MPKPSPADSPVPAPFADKTRGIRLQKAMANAGVASRRDCEQLILDGLVRVNSQPVTALPAWVDPTQDRIEVAGREIARPRKTAAAAAGDEKPGKVHKVGGTYIMLHKPRRVISTTDDEQGRTNVTDLVDLPRRVRLFPVGRLDAESTGLILLTDDGDLANRLTHPRYQVAKEYRVTVRGKLTQDDLQKLRDGLMLTRPAARTADAPAGSSPVKRASVESVAIISHDKDRARGDRTTLRMVLREGQNREIRRLVARLGFKVRRLTRTAIGPLRLKGLAPGQWRKLTPTELATLRKAAGLKKKSSS